MLKYWGYHLENKYPVDCTFYHPNGVHKSQIDYIIANQKEVVKDVKVLQKHALNTSTHVAITSDIVLHDVDVACNSNEQESAAEDKISQKRIKWEKVDKLQYQDVLNNHMQKINFEEIDSASDCLDLIHNALQDTTDSLGRTSVPKGRKKGKLISKPVKHYSAISKNIFWRLKTFSGTESERAGLEAKSKEAKRALRRAQRMESAEMRHRKYKEIMEADSNCQKLFFKLIRYQREGNTRRLSHLFIDDVKLTDDSDIREGWSQYFQKLSTPIENSKYDNEYKELVETDIKFIEEICSEQSESGIDLSVENIQKVISGMKNGKSSDVYNISVEHLKYGGTQLWKLLGRLYQLIIEEKSVPVSFREGLITPIYKKQSKPISDPNSYRRITICSVIGKVFEKLHLQAVESYMVAQQNKLQRGFTKGTSPVLTSLLLTEAIAEASDLKQELHATFLDASKAFDTVWHASMLRKLYAYGLNGTDWLLMKSWYSDMRSQVKWEGGISKFFTEMQGVRQGGIWSPTAYKMYLNPALDMLERKDVGLKIGTINMSSPTCADDQLLLSSDRHELSSLTNFQENYANMERYVLSEQKTKVMTFNRKHPQPSEVSLNGKLLEQVESYKHIGITRYEDSTKSKKKATENAIATGRRTLYSLMGAGMHGYNGINPTVSIKMWNIFVKPRMLYGLESLTLRSQDLKLLSQFHKRFLKQIMQLPDRTSDSGVYILSGEIPLEADVDKKVLTQLANILGGDGVEKELMRRQLAVKSGSSKSWFIYAKSVLEKYSLPSIYDLIDDDVDKRMLGRKFKRCVNDTWLHRIITDAEQKTSLRYLNVKSFKIGQPHNIWTDVNIDTLAVKKAGIKAKMLCGTYMLQSKRAKYTGSQDNLCPLCKKEPEDITHFLLICEALQNVRDPFITKLEDILRAKNVLETLQTRQDIFIQVILDVTHSSVPITLQDDETLHALESLSRGMCFALHSAREAGQNPSK